MSVKRIIKLIFSIIFFCLSTLFILFQYTQISNAQNETAKHILTQIFIDIKHGELTDTTIASMPKNFFYAIWLKKNKSNWLPVIYDKNILLKKNLIDPYSIPNYIAKTSRLYPKVINDYKFIIWITKYNLEYFIKKIILPIFFLLLLYLLLLLIIEIVYKEEPISITNEDQFQEELYDNSIINDIPNSNNKSQEQQALIEYYKELWSKNFKISNNFKNNFPFKKIYDLVKFGIKPEQYINQVIEIASLYFKWENPKLYIHQKDYFIESSTKMTLDHSKINIPKHGEQKGSIYIPLFPYTISTIYGYFYFEWNNEKDFYISDILYFLKFFFSDRAKPIFLNYKELENIINIVKIKLEKECQVFCAILEVDNKEKLNIELQSSWIEELNEKIKEKLINSFKEELVFQISSLNFIIIGEKVQKEEKTQAIQKWINDNDIQNYPISKEYGDIALSFSCGIAFKDQRDLHALTLINEAEDNLKIAIKKG